MAGEVLRKKLLAAQQALTEGGPGADRAWRLGFARAARDMMQLPVDFVSLTLNRLSLTELLDLPPDRALILMLEGPEDGLGLLILSPDLLASLIEMLTMGKCAAQPPDSRKPTRTDAAILSPLADLALANLEEALAEDADLVWTSGFRYASFIEEARPLALMLEDVIYRTLTARIALGQGTRTGDMILVLPAEGRGRKPRINPRSIPDAVARPAFAASLAAQVDSAICPMDAVLARLSMPLGQVMLLTAGAILPLPQARLERISLEGLDGRRVAEGKLGQHRGMRAIRLALDPAQSDAPVGSEMAPASVGPEPAWGGPDIASDPGSDFGFAGFSATGTG